MLEAVALLIVLTAFFAWLNERTLKLPPTVGVALAGAASSLVLIVLDELGLAGARGWAERSVEALDFSQFVLGGILSALLFAGALGLDAREVLRRRTSILVLALVSTLISSALIGLVSYAVFGLLGIDLPLLWALLFGALISPTDPVAVLDLLKREKVPKRIETVIAGESLFNDGIGIVLFLVLAALAGVGGHGTIDPTVGNALLLFAQEAGGGVLFGLALGAVGYFFTKTIEAHGVELLITLALVVGGYALAFELGVSGPLAMVVAGLVMSYVKEAVFAEKTLALTKDFWELLDEILNVVLFTLIGLTVVLAEPSVDLVAASAILVVVALLSRFVSVAIPISLIRRREGYGPWTIRLLTWAGLRGGIAIGLVLSLPPGQNRDILLTPTFAIVLFTIVVQGLTVVRVVRRAMAPATRSPDPA
ncbi:MAG: cation:proton antiporter [Nocardioides sp.]